jgi:hypothetical protein
MLKHVKFSLILLFTNTFPRPRTMRELSALGTSLYSMSAHKFLGKRRTFYVTHKKTKRWSVNSYIETSKFVFFTWDTKNDRHEAVWDVFAFQYPDSSIGIRLLRCRQPNIR